MLGLPGAEGLTERLPFLSALERGKLSKHCYCLECRQNVKSATQQKLYCRWREKECRGFAGYAKDFIGSRDRIMEPLSPEFLALLQLGLPTMPVEPRAEMSPLFLSSDLIWHFLSPWRFPLRLYSHVHFCLVGGVVTCSLHFEPGPWAAAHVLLPKP